MRHGEVEYFGGAGPAENAINGTLTERGREQAAAAGRALRGIDFNRVITSGLPRTLETARLVLSEVGMAEDPPVEQWPDLEEFRGTVLEGIADSDVDDAFQTIFHGIPSREDVLLGGESVGSVVDRVNAALDRLLKAADWDTVLMVLHGGVNRAILSRALLLRPSFIGHIEQSPGCFNIIDVGPGWFIRAINVTPADPAHDGLRLTSVEELAAGYRAYRGFTLT
jgi:probable phosphoglycerate mutase